MLPLGVRFFTCSIDPLNSELIAECLQGYLHGRLTCFWGHYEKTFQVLLPNTNIQNATSPSNIYDFYNFPYSIHINTHQSLLAYSILLLQPLGYMTGFLKDSCHLFEMSVYSSFPKFHVYVETIELSNPPNAIIFPIVCVFVYHMNTQTSLCVLPEAGRRHQMFCSVTLASFP